MQVEATGCGLDLVLVVGAGSDPFYIGKHEVTPDEWRSIVGEWPENYYLDVIAEWHPPSPQKEPPAVAVVDWFDLDEFKSRTGMRLPTVREWREAFHADGNRPVHLSDYYEYCEPGRAEPGDIDIFARRRDRGVLSGSFRVARDP